MDMLKERAPQKIEMQKVNSTRLKSYYLKKNWCATAQGKKKTKKLHSRFGTPFTSSSNKISNPYRGIT